MTASKRCGRRNSEAIAARAKLSRTNRIMCLWKADDTGDAMRHFGAMDGEVSAKEVVKKRIEKLQQGHATATGWKRTIDDFDQQEFCVPSMTSSRSN